jgi:hypothetical protein
MSTPLGCIVQLEDIWYYTKQMTWNLSNRDYEALRTISIYSDGKESTSIVLARHMSISVQMAIRYINKYKRLYLIDLLMSSYGRNRCYKLTTVGEALTDVLEEMQVSKKRK